MPTTVEEFWGDLTGASPNRFAIAGERITNDKDGLLVNSISNKKTFLLYVLTNPKAWVLLDLIAHHPKFNTLNYAPADLPGNTAIHKILSTYRPDILEKFLHLDDIVFNGTNLSYVEANEHVTNVEQSYLEEKTSNPNSDETLEAQTDLTNVQLMRRKLIDKTIDYARKTWDATITTRPEIPGLSRVGNEEEQGLVVSYTKATLYIASLLADYHTKDAKNPKSDETAKAYSTWQNAKLMRELFRDHMIEKAEARNKASILDALVAAGDRIVCLSRDGQRFYKLATRPPLPVQSTTEWHKARSENLALEYSQNRQTFINQQQAVNEAAKKLADLSLQYQQGKQAIYDKSAGNAQQYAATVMGR